eukprot:33172_1
MSTVQDAFKQLQPLPLQCDYYFPKPLFYNSNEIIISTDSSEDNPGILKYNINTNKLELIHKHDATFRPGSHGHFIDYKNKILYLFGGVKDTFSAFNLKTNTMTDMGSNNSGVYVKSVVITSTNQIYILTRYKTHFMFDCTNKSFRPINCKGTLL